MWKLKSVYIENIVSFKEASLDIEQGVATLIFGHNEDNASQPCNGSGKSSLIEAISFGLTGEQLRKVKSVEEIINDHANDAYVQLVLENDYNNTVLMIERNISRNAPQSIECHKYDSSGNEIDQHLTVQPSVSDYNKYILGEIGLTKDDIYNNFILCDNKYESFFDCSDRNKKEIINRFSNCGLVDESIERVHKDMVPAEESLKEADKNVSGAKGAIAAIENELDSVNQKKEEAKANKENRITYLDSKITNCREEIEVCKDKISKAIERLDILSAIHQQVDDMESSTISMEDAYRIISEKFEEFDIEQLTDYVKTMSEHNRRIQDLNDLASKIKSNVKKISNEIKSLRDECLTKHDIYQCNLELNNKQTVEDEEKIKKLDDDVDKIDDRLDGIYSDIEALQKKNQDLYEQTISIQNILHGKIVCPKCQYEFVLNSEENVEELNERLDKLKQSTNSNNAKITELNGICCKLDKDAEEKVAEIKKIKNNGVARNDALYNEMSSIRSISKQADCKENELKEIKSRVDQYQIEIDKINGKVELLRSSMFSEASSILDRRIMQGKSYIAQQESDISFQEAQMKQYQKSKQDILEAPEEDFESGLKKSLEKYRKELRTAQNAYDDAKKHYDELESQEINFNMFKSYLAKKKIDALSLIVNDFLEKIGSDIRLRLEGFSVTKTGKLRDKISVQVTRDGVDCGSYHKFSGGEKARLNLACILSLHTLTNSNCEDGKGLDFLIIDELLDKSDEVGMSTYCDALNKLHQTALLITQGAISEGYPHRLLVTKRQGFSTLSK